MTRSLSAYDVSLSGSLRITAGGRTQLPLHGTYSVRTKHAPHVIKAIAITIRLSTACDVRGSNVSAVQHVRQVTIVALSTM